MEILIDIYIDDYSALANIQKQFTEVEVEFTSGLSGLEIAGTIVIPSVALFLQIISFIKDMKKESHPSTEIKKIECHFDTRIIVISANATEEEILKTLKDIK